MGASGRSPGYRARLLAERRALLAEVASLASVRDDPGEEVERRLLWMSLSRGLREVEDALRRLDEGRFGLCEECGVPISPARLRAFPRARRCVVCQAREDWRTRARRQSADPPSLWGAGRWAAG